MPAVADIQNSVIKEFENNPDVVVAIYNEGGAHGETRSWLETVWSNYYLRGKIIWDSTGANSKNNYNQPNTGLPFGRSYIIDQQGNIALAIFGYDPGLVIRTIYELVDKPPIGSLRNLADGTEARLPGRVVTAGSSQIGGAFYLEESNRSAGIRVQWPVSPAVQPGVLADVVGRMSTLNTGERQIIPTSVTPGATASVDPLGLTPAALGGYGNIPGAAGAYNVGLLVKTWGKVTEMGAGCFWIDDGADIQADAGHAGVRVVTGGLPLPGDLGVGAYVTVTGISGCVLADNGTAVRSVLTRRVGDIAVVLRGPGP